MLCHGFLGGAGFCPSTVCCEGQVAFQMMYHSPLLANLFGGLFGGGEQVLFCKSLN